jgi:hypothetical protein
MLHNQFGALYHQIAYKMSIHRHFIEVEGWGTFACFWIKGLIVVVGYWYLDDCHEHVVYDDLVKILICLDVVEKAGVWNPWMGEEKAVGHLLSESL